MPGSNRAAVARTVGASEKKRQHRGRRTATSGTCLKKFSSPAEETKLESKRDASFALGSTTQNGAARTCGASSRPDKSNSPTFGNAQRMTNARRFSTTCCANTKGLSPGVKETLRAMRDPTPPSGTLHGLVADLIRVNVEAAPLHRTCARSNGAVYRRPAGTGALPAHRTQRRAIRAGRRVHLPRSEPRRDDPVRFSAREQPGRARRADQFVETEPHFAAPFNASCTARGSSNRSRSLSGSIETRANRQTSSLRTARSLRRTARLSSERRKEAQGSSRVQRA